MPRQDLVKQETSEKDRSISVSGNLIGILTCDFCKWKIYQIGLFQKDDGKFFLGLNCAKCGASVTAIEDVQEYAKAVVNPVAQ